MTDYYNTTNLTGADLVEATQKAGAQEEVILAFFKAKKIEKFAWSPSEVWEACFFGRCPLTSVRRAMTNLTNQGKLERMDEQKKGPYGRPEHYWRLVSSQLDLFKI